MTEKQYSDSVKVHNLKKDTITALKWTSAIIAISILIAILTGCAAPRMAPERVGKNTPTHHSARTRITYYSGKHERVAMNGHRAVQGRSAAARPSVKFGTQIKIPDLYKFLGDDTFVIEDRGSAVTSRKASHGTTDVIDIYVKNYSTMKMLERDAPAYMEIETL